MGENFSPLLLTGVQKNKFRLTSRRLGLYFSAFSMY